MTSLEPFASELKLGILSCPADEESSLPLEHTDVIAQVTGPVSAVSVTQRFANPFDVPVVLEYLFPVPHEAAITHFELRAGGRVIISRVEEAGAARRVYDDARDKGRRAGLLAARRPNLFSIELANVQPGETITASIRYQERLRYDDGEYTFVFPMGITPKYHRDPAEAAATTAPIAGGGAPIGTVDLQVSIDAGTRAGDPTSPSHEVEWSRLDEHRLSVRLAGEQIPNKDFVLRFAVDQADVAAAVWLASGDGRKPQPSQPSYALITAIPPRLSRSMEPAPREFLFVIDRSGSMRGGPIEQAKNALRACVRSLGSEDTFSILAFDDRLEWFAPAPAKADQASMNAADRWIAALGARGGTEIGAALEAALAIPADEKRQRYVVFLTDGAISDDRDVIAAVRKRIGEGRVFTFGIGPSVNRSLLASIASAGRGTSEFLQVDEDIEAALIRFQDRIAFPALLDVAVDWKGATAWDVTPERLADLYDGQALELTARVQVNAPGASVVITGRRANEPWRVEIPLPSPSNEPAIARIWAKSRVDALLSAIDGNEGNIADHRNEVIALAVEHQLATRFTSFVAVDEHPTEGGEPVHVRIALPLPEGLQEEAFTPVAAQLRAFDASVACAMEPLFDLEPRSVADSTVASRRMRTTRRAAAAPDPLRELARIQNASGSWGSGAEEIDSTAAAILAFVRHGHTTRSGHYRRQLTKAMRWLLAATAAGVAATARAIALAELGDAIGDGSLSALRDTVMLPPLPLKVDSIADLRVWALHHKSPDHADAVPSISTAAMNIWGIAAMQ